MVYFIIQNMKKNKTRTIVTILGIVLSSVLIFCLGFGFSTIRQYRFDQVAQEIGSYHVSYRNLKATQYNTLLTYPNIKTVRFQKRIQKVTDHNFEISVYETNGLELSTVILKEGKYPNQLGEILLPSSMKQVYGNIGNKMVLDQKYYQISGFYHEDIKENVIEVLFYTYVPHPTFDGNYDYAIEFKSIENLEEQVFRLGNDLQLPLSQDPKIHEQENINYDLLATSFYTSEVSKTIDTLILVIALSCLSFVSMLIIYNAFAISVNEQRVLYGILASVGATPRQRFLLIILEATIYAVIAIPIGLLLSMIVINGWMLGVNHLLKPISLLQYHFCMYPTFLWISFFYLVGMIYFSALIPALDVKRMNPIRMIRQSDVIKKKKSKGSLLGIEATIAKKNYERNKRKYEMVTLSIVVGIVISLLTITFTRFYNYQKKIICDSNRPNISFTIQIDDNISTDLKTLDSIIPTEEWTRIYRPIIAVNSPKTIMILALDDDSFHDYQEKLHQKKERPILLNWYSKYNFANDPNRREEGIIFNEIPKEIQFYHIDWKNQVDTEFICIDDFLVTTILPDMYYLESQKIATLFVSETMLNTMLTQANIEVKEEYYNIQIDTTSFLKVHEWVKRISDQYPKQVTEYQNQSFDHYKNKIENLIQQSIFYGIILFILIISITGMINTLSASIQLRRKEFALLRSIGMDEKGFDWMIQYECILIGSNALLIGIVIYIIILFLINLIFYQLPNISENQLLLPNPLDFVILIIVVFVIVFISAHDAIRKVKKENIIDVLKESL